MARINYYQFPDTVDAHTRFVNGAESHDGECAHQRDTCKGCPTNNGSGWRECEHWKCTASDDTIGGITVTAAKKLLRMFGGSAWTQHIDRDGGCFEVSEIKISANNSKFKYNRHL
jgi:hypothetical protein